MKEIVVATSNAGKLAEIQAILTGYDLLAQKDFAISSIEETGKSFVENALLKARHASQIAKKPALADDSGLIVNVLQGAPGIYSARYAGINAADSDNINYLLKQLATTPGEARQAYFYCVMVYIRHANDPAPIIACGQLAGHIAQQPQGQNGFGYDPIFYLPDYHCTVAELSSAIKNKLSHRAKDLQQLHQQLQDDDTVWMNYSNY